MAPTPSIPDIAIAVFMVARILFLHLPFFLVTRLYHDVTGQSGRYHQLPLSKLVELFIIRSMTTYLPVSITRCLSDIGLPGRILTSPRYAPYAKTLFEHVSDPGFRGVWIIRNRFAAAASGINLDPSNSDIVIYYLHGGGYFSSSPATYTLFLLRLAESIIEAGRSVSIFALDYDLAPEAAFPTQLVQASKGYEWLVRNKDVGGIGIDRRKLVIIGDSAGGHLSLSLLVNLWKPLVVEEGCTPTAIRSSKEVGNNLALCSGLVLLSPWLSLFHIPESFTRNALTDLLSRDFLDRTAKGFLGPECHGSIQREKAAWLEFLDEKSGIDWHRVLPDWVWVSAGKNEILYDDVVRWVNDREIDCRSNEQGHKSRRIVGELNEDEVHDYAWLKTADQKLSRRLCNTRMGEKGGLEEFEAIERIATAVVERQKLGSEVDRTSKSHQGS